MAVIQAMLLLLRAAPAGRIVNVTSELGSLGGLCDRAFPYPTVGGLGYGPSKTALNAITWRSRTSCAARRSRSTPRARASRRRISTGHRGPRTVEQAACAPVRLATLPADGPTGGFFNEDGPLPW
jgi:hypothetical protein